MELPLLLTQLPDLHAWDLEAFEYGLGYLNLTDFLRLSNLINASPNQILKLSEATMLDRITGLLTADSLVGVVVSGRGTIHILDEVTN